MYFIYIFIYIYFLHLYILYCLFSFCSRCETTCLFGTDPNKCPLMPFIRSFSPTRGMSVLHTMCFCHLGFNHRLINKWMELNCHIICWDMHKLFVGTTKGDMWWISSILSTRRVGRVKTPHTHQSHESMTQDSVEVHFGWRWNSCGRGPSNWALGLNDTSVICLTIKMACCQC